MYNKILEDTRADLKTEWEYLAKTFGSCTMVEVAHAVISAVNYDEPELYVNSPNPKAGIILGDIFPRMGDFIATDKFAMGPVRKFMSRLADSQSGN